MTSGTPFTLASRPVFPCATVESIHEELERVDRALDRAGEGLIVDPAQYLAHRARLEHTRSQLVAQLDELTGTAAA